MLVQAHHRYQIRDELLIMHRFTMNKEELAGNGILKPDFRASEDYPCSRIV